VANASRPACRLAHLFGSRSAVTSRLEPPEAGSCQCGACAFTVASAPFVAYTCHCTECQRLSASAFTTCMQVASEGVEITSGTLGRRARTADSGNTLETWFCTTCGSALFSRNSARPRIATVYVGTLRNARAVTVDAHIWTDRKLPWVMLPEGHRQFPGPGDWTRDYAGDIERYRPADAWPRGEPQR